MNLIDFKKQHALGEISDQEYYFAIHMLLIKPADMTEQQKTLWTKLKKRLSK